MKKVWILIAFVGLLLAVWGCSLGFKSASGARSSVNAPVQATPSPTPSPAILDEYKAIFLFADQSLEETTKNLDPADLAEAPWSLFASSLAASREGKVEEAKKHLKQVLAMRDNDSRLRLSAWNALRELGERPPANVADKVQGVVCELHNRLGVVTIAGYSDGTARWVGALGKVIVWEPPGEPEVNALIRDLLKSTEPLVKTVPVSNKHRTPEPELNYSRISILTYNGIYIVENFAGDVDERHPVVPVLNASVKLTNALVKASMKQK